MKTLVLYFSRSGNNFFLAKKLEEETGGVLEKIQPRMGGLFFLLLLSALGLDPGIKKIPLLKEQWDHIIVCGPVYMGLLLYPMKKALSQALKTQGKVSFATACGSSEKDKDSRFSFYRVFEKGSQMLCLSRNWICDPEQYRKCCGGKVDRGKFYPRNGGFCKGFGGLSLGRNIH